MMNFFKMMGELGKVQGELHALRFEGKAGGDMVKVTVDGAQKVVDCTIDPQLVADQDIELLESLVASAVNVAVDQSRQAAAELFQKNFADQLNIPGLGGMLGNLLKGK